MKRFLTASIALVALAVMTACGGSTVQNSLLPSQPQMQMPSVGLSQTELMIMQAPRFRACPDTPAGTYHCDAILSTFSMSPDSLPSCAHAPGCYGPADLQAAYGMTAAAKTKGKGVTVAVVDAYGYAGGYNGFARDLNTYRKAWGLPPCPKTCLKIVNQNGGSSLPKPGKYPYGSWQGEEALDADMVSAICPNCTILLVQANSSSTSDLIVAGVATALKMSDIVSNSFGGSEYTKSYALYDSHPHKVIVASSGDSGAGAPGGSPEQQPCGFAGVVCVGGTSLTLHGGQYGSEVVWDGLTSHHCGSGPCATGSGCSKLVPKPSWQTDKGCTMRSAVDVSAEADPYTGVIVACTPCGGSYGAFFAGDGGTSLTSPLVAGMYALAGNATSLSNPSATIWGKGGTSAFHDVTKGINDKKGVTGLVCTAKIAYICKAGPGYDGPTGWGSPNGLGAL